MGKEPAKQDKDDSLDELKAASSALKEKIVDEKRKNDMPINASLGDPEIDARNADGRNDLREDEEE